MSAIDLSLADRRAENAAGAAVLDRLAKGDLLLGYQARTHARLFAGTALLVIEKSRRIGLTWGVAAYCVLRAASQVSAGGQSCWYMGYDKDMTLEFIETCAMWARAFGIVGTDTAEEVLDDGDGNPVQAFRIRFASGFKITALPSVPRALRGKQGIVVIDEAAFHKNVDEVIKSAMALLIWGGQVIVISTHDGIGNAFNVLLDDIRAGRRRGETMTITFADAMADGLYERVALVAKTKGAELPDKAEWEAQIRASYGDDAEEELDCIPKAGSGSLIKPEDLAACEHPEAGIAELYQGGLMYFGRDVARRQDGQIQYGMEMVGDVLWQRDTYEEVGQTFAHQDAFMDDVFARRRVVRALLDQTGMGEKVVEDQQIKHGTSRVQGVLLTGPNRLDLALGLATRFERGLIRIRPDPRTRADLRAIKKLDSAGGGVRIVNEGKVHADRFWAYALASRAADGAIFGVEYHNVPRGYRAPGDRQEDRPGRRHGSRFGREGAW
ncbi:MULTISPECIES: phage terminase large subunit family protein [unclassified Sphingomonas]|uniref:phage terminase large subunit family protein n=1 Tax=unclassified Sphingomonas TaxID=196159 RepID=UPI00082C49F0|nr:MULTISPECIES: terminase family protein [unclassified Sphingomonas]